MNKEFEEWLKTMPELDENEENIAHQAFEAAQPKWISKDVIPSEGSKLLLKNKHNDYATGFVNKGRIYYTTNSTLTIFLPTHYQIIKE